MKNNIKFNNSNILYTFSSVNSKYTVELTYDFINQYQLQNTSIKISSKSNSAISSIDIRKLNIYSLNKKAQKQISNLADVDNNYFIKKTGNKDFSKINVSKFVKNINTRSTTNRNELMCQYAYVYDFYIKSNHNNYSLFLAKKLFNQKSIDKFDLIIDLQSKIRNTLILNRIPSKYFYQMV